MARARQSVTFTDLLEIASKLPWQVSLGLAAISLLALHGLAAAFASAPTVTTVADMGGVVIHQGVHVGALLLQFVVPPAFLIGATASYFKRARSIQLLKDTRTAKGPAVASLTWQQFESLVAEGLRSQKKAARPRTAALISSSHAAMNVSSCSVSNGEPSRFRSPSCVSYMGSWRHNTPPAATSSPRVDLLKMRSPLRKGAISS